MRIFITGGTGFIGKYVVKELASRGHKLFLLFEEPKNKLPRFFTGKNIRVIRGNLSDKRWQGSIKKFKPEAAVHLAWDGLPNYDSETSIRNLKYGLDLYRFLADIKCKKILTAGTCWEYGNQSGKLSEDMLVSPFNAFAVAKNALNWLGSEIAKENGITFIWARIFYVYGPGQRKGSLIPYLISCKKGGIKPEIKNPNSGNDFIHVDDVALALRMLLEKRIKGSGAVYNIGTGRLTSNAKVVNAAYGEKIYAEPRMARGFYADISKIKKETGWKPLVDINKGLKDTVSYYQN